MKKTIQTLLLFFFGSLSGLVAQSDDPVLFTVAGNPVHVSEFEYIYTKTNGKEADFSEKSLEEYLDLYVRFKLKVQRAKEMQLDTIPSLKKELDGYRRQLADSYLIDKEVTEKLTREAYERAKQDVEISHVLVSVDANAAPEDTLEAYNKALAIRSRILKGEDFSEVAKALSDDKSAANNGGYIGFVNVLFPNGFYKLETAAYTLPIGELSQPVRTNSGYHILKVHSRRPARGEMEAAHILIRSEKNPDDGGKTLIDSLYQLLETGASFESLAKEYSEDGRTASKGGYIGFFGINRFQAAFEDIAFALEENDAYSAPVQTSVGWHIIKRISRRTIQPYAIEKSRLQTQIKRDARHEQARLAMIARIKEEAGLEENKEVLTSFVDTLPENFLTFKWKAPKVKSSKTLFQLGPDFKVSLGEFTDYLGSASRQRIRMGRSTPIPQAVDQLYKDFVDMSCMKYEEQQLEKKYPEFKMLMGEYEEGILLFEATKMEVWDKASQDTAGLKVFHQRVKDNFRWDERAVAVTYNVISEAAGKVDTIRAFAQEHSTDEVLAMFNSEEKTIVTADNRTVEKKKNDLFFQMPWKAGEVSEVKQTPRSKGLYFTKIEDILPARNKTLDEARGYVIADYQDYLETQWVKQLKDKYKVEIKQKVFNKLIK
jgi:peptidyl-prolyl cis-trans isomerase SurA